MNNVMRVVKEEQLEVFERKQELSCTFKIRVKKNELEKVGNRLAKIRGLIVKDLKNS
jgi:hypothetical protein